MTRARRSRRTPAQWEPIAKVRLRTGRDYVVVDISDSGLLLEGGRLLPGTHVDLHVVTNDGRVLVRSRVLRVRVHAMTADTIIYRAALAFDRAIDTSPVVYRLPGDLTRPQDDSGSEYPGDQDKGAVDDADRSAA